MYEMGMLRKAEDIKLLVLYAARELAQPVTKDELFETVSPGETVNYFDLVEVFDDLIATGHVDHSIDEPTVTYFLTPLGVETIGLLERSLPYTVREIVSKNALAVLAKIRYHSMVFTTKDFTGKGVSVTFNMKESGDTLFKLELLVPNENQANAIIRVFERNPAKICSRIIDVLVKPQPDDEDEEKNKK